VITGVSQHRGVSAAPKIQPVFMGGTIAEHRMFILSLCRYQHVSLLLCLFHYVTWSVSQIALFVLVGKLLGPIGATALAVLLIAWALAVEVRVGVVFGFLVAGYALLARDVLELSTISSWTAGTTVLFAATAIMISLAVESASHVVIQGIPFGPPSRKSFTLPRGQLPLVGLYFAVVFGLFFLTLDLTMRLLGYHGQEHLRVNEITNDWHRVAAAEFEASGELRKRDWHLGVLASQS